MGVYTLANKSTSVRTASGRALIVFGLVLAFQLPLYAAGSPHGTTRGLVSANPEWSLGLQVGNFGATGLTLQKLAFYEGTLQINLGVIEGSAGLSVDYIMMLNEDFRRLPMREQSPAAQLRGHLLPYLGGGLLVSRHTALHLPFGLTYAMLRDPFQFFGGLALIFGPFLSEGDKATELWFNLGFRALL